MRDSPFHHYCQKCKRDFVNREALSQVWRFWYYRVPVQLIVQSITGAHASMKTVTVINVISSLTTRMIWTRWGTILIFRGWLTSIDSISEIPKNIHIAVVVRKSLTMTTTWRRWIMYCKDWPFTVLTWPSKALPNFVSSRRLRLPRVRRWLWRWRWVGRGKCLPFMTNWYLFLGCSTIKMNMPQVTVINVNACLSTTVH